MPLGRILTDSELAIFCFNLEHVFLEAVPEFWWKVEEAKCLALDEFLDVRDVVFRNGDCDDLAILITRKGSPSSRWGHGVA